ncbi:MAG: tyrosine-type recombinase/integrase, partial [Acidimicrobiales bacterium]
VAKGPDVHPADISSTTLPTQKPEAPAQRTVSPLDGREGWTVVDDRYVEHARAGDYLRALLDAGGRSVGTAHAYAGRLALYLAWAAQEGIDELSLDARSLAAFARWLERTPSRKHRKGRVRRRVPSAGVVSLTPTRSAATVEGALAAVVDFVRFGVSRGWCDAASAEGLSDRRKVRFVPGCWDRGEATGPPVVQRRRVRRRHAEKPPMTLTRAEVTSLVEACSNARDRLLVEMTYASGLRAAECLGLRLSDLHFLPSSAHLGCKAAGPHLHVVRREDNENGALAKSLWPRVVPVTARLVLFYDAYRAQRDEVPEAAESDYLFVNLHRPPLGRAMTAASAEELFERLSARVGPRARPHMLRHSFASEIAAVTNDPALVKELLGHATVSSVNVYLHSRWGDMRAAVESLNRARL